MVNRGLALFSNREEVVPLATFGRIVCLNALNGPSARHFCTLNLEVSDAVVHAIRLPVNSTDLSLTHDSFRSATAKYAAVPRATVVIAELDITVTLCIQTIRQSRRGLPGNSGKTNTKLALKVVKFGAASPYNIITR
jgi:hypothetical protein